MMYHLKFSLTGGASCSDGCSSGFCPSGKCPSAAIVSVPSLCMRFDCEWTALVLREVLDQLGDSVANREVDQVEVSSEDEDGDEDDRGGRLHLGARGRDHLAHLGADV